MTPYSDAEAAALYDVLNPWRADSDFCLQLVMAAGSVLDVGCGTGPLLHRARQEGHTGRLCGIDPDRAMLARARRREDIEWVDGTAAGMDWDGEFELAVMTGHAFQMLVTDNDVKASLAAIQRALAPGGCFAFETRNPLVRAWEEWTPEHGFDVVDPVGRRVFIAYEVESVVGDVVTLIETTSGEEGTVLRQDRASLRFLDVEALRAFLMNAGFAVEAQYGTWERGPLTPESQEIITVARVASRVAAPFS
jgi:ubiquinone/menaquinone biosynthesis C-methylase UbiE